MSKETCFSFVTFLRLNEKAKWRVTSDPKGSNLRVCPEPDVCKTISPTPALLNLPRCDYTGQDGHSHISICQPRTPQLR